MQTNEELATAIQNGKQELLDQLWRQCYGFIRQQAIRWAKAWESRTDFDVDDLTQAGYIALCEAVKGFQADRGGFIGFLSFYLKTEFAKVAGCRTEAQMQAPSHNAISLDAPAYNDTDNDTTIGDTIPADDPGFDAVEESVYIQQLAALLDQAMNELPEKQRQVIELYYLRRLTYIRIAEILNCSVTYTGQLAKGGLKGLKKGSYADDLATILYGERDYYSHTSFGSWKNSGCSSPEWELLWKERKARQYNIHHSVKHLEMTRKQARRLFPA